MKNPTISQVSLRPLVNALATIAIFAPALLLTGLVHAQALHENLLYSFSGQADGNLPVGLIRDSAGNFYGSTVAGGTGTCNGGCGTVFKLDASGAETVLHSFAGGADGYHPNNGLARDSAGNLYGTTYIGGAGCPDPGCGTIFKVDSVGNESVLYSFTGKSDGAYPSAGLVLDTAGNLYGTTAYGGAPSCICGTVFKQSKSGKFTLLYTFSALNGDAETPYAPLIRDGTGNLYGTTYTGGTYGYGTVFKLDPGGNETVIYSFTGVKGDGANPSTGLLRDAVGNLYGTTDSGGHTRCSYPYGCGVVYKIDANGNETVLHAFNGKSDGGYPLSALIGDGHGNLYGTANNAEARFGLVYQLNPAGQLTVLYSFNGTDGSEPGFAPLVKDPSGKLYGVTELGGLSSAGVVFELTP